MHDAAALSRLSPHYQRIGQENISRRRFDVDFLRSKATLLDSHIILESPQESFIQFSWYYRDNGRGRIPHRDGHVLRAEANDEHG